MKRIQIVKRYILGVAVVAAVVCVPLVHPIAVGATSNLAGEWKFDETVSGSNALDSSGNGNDGIPNTFGSDMPTPSTDTPPAITFNDPRSASFDGDNYFLINRPVQDDFTICAWVETTSAGNGPNHWETAPIMDSEVGGVTNDFGFGIADNGTLAYGNGDLYGNDLAVDGNTPVNDGQWHNVCVSRDSNSGAVNLYVDAQNDGNGYTSPGTLDANPYARIGYGFDGAALFNGNIDDVRAYNVVLTPTQIANLVSGSNNPNASGDGDGIDTAVEDAAPNSGDANNDGTLDSLQSSVSSFLNSQTNSYTSVEVSNTCDLSAVGSVDSTSLTADTGYNYPHGFINYTAGCGTPGFSATATLYFYGVANNNVVLRKYDPVSHTYATVSGAVITSVTIGGHQATKVVYSVTDGGNLDSDGLVNGTIVDPVGLGIANPPTATLASVPASPPATPAAKTLPDTGFAVADYSLWPLILIVLGGGLLAAQRVIRSKQ